MSGSAPQIELMLNPRRQRSSDSVPAPADARRFHRRLPGYVPTRVVDAPELAASLGLRRLWIKDESFRLGLPSYKIVGASWATYRLLVERLGAEPAWSTLDDLRTELRPLGPQTLVAATDGNHGRAVARVARWLGYRARIVVPESIAPARVAAIRREPARVDVIAGDYDDAVAAAVDLAGDGVPLVSDTASPGHEAVTGWVGEGYRTIAAELDEQLPDDGPDVVLVQMGVGALTAAMVEHFGARARIVAVEPTVAACGLRSAAAGRPVTVPGPHCSIMAGLNCGSVSTTAWPTIAAGVDAFVAIDDAWVGPAVRAMARTGVVAGETGAAGLAGLMAMLSLRPPGGFDLTDRSVLVLCTEGVTNPVSDRRARRVSPDGRHLPGAHLRSGERANHQS